MKISGKKPEVGAAGYVGKAGGAADQTKKTDGGGRTAGADSVSISTKAREFSKAEALLASVPDVRSDMVVRLKTEIDSGSYHVDAGKVAEKMIERALRNALMPKN